jgi:hypothetical protein
VLEFAWSRAASASYSLVELTAGDADATTLRHRIARRTGASGQPRRPLSKLVRRDSRRRQSETPPFQ